MSKNTPTWPKVLVGHSWRRMNEQDNTKVYVAGAETMFEGQLHLSKNESIISALVAIHNATEHLHKGINLIIDANVINMKKPQFPDFLTLYHDDGIQLITYVDDVFIRSIELITTPNEMDLQAFTTAHKRLSRWANDHKK